MLDKIARQTASSKVARAKPQPADGRHAEHHSLEANGTGACSEPFLILQQEEASMSEISKTTKHGEYREDGSKIATEDNPAGETETEKVEREQSKLPNGGRSPEYDEADEDDIAAPSPPTGA
ncbi:hypothetical protein [Aureimonas glaciei]|nr:hypothetical protein [Aureimonas glaciei]